MSRFRLNISKLKNLNHNGIVRRAVDMSEFCTFRCGGKANVLIEICTLENFLKVIMYIEENNIPYFILGAGSNVLVSDKGYDGVVIKFAGDLARIEQVEDSVFECGAGVKIAELFSFVSGQSLSGIEDGSGIPASIGGATYMNAGAYDFQMANVVEYVVAYVDGKIDYFDNDQCSFGYRSSIFQRNNAIILRVAIRFVKKNKSDIMDRFYEIAKKRASSQPLDKPCAGCVFKRLDNVIVSKLIDDAGLKGLTIGGMQVSNKHANFIINVGNGLSQDVYQLIKVIKIKVKEKFGVDLITEIKFLGEFE